MLDTSLLQSEMSWAKQIIFAKTFRVVHGCLGIDDIGCAKVWYFWFVIIWICLFIFIGLICVINRCQNRKIRPHRRLSRSRERGMRQPLTASDGQISPMGSTLSNGTIRTSTTTLSPQSTTPKGSGKPLSIQVNKHPSIVPKSSGFLTRPNSPNLTLPNSMHAHYSRRRPGSRGTNFSPSFVPQNPSPTPPKSSQLLATVDNKEISSTNQQNSSNKDQVQNGATDNKGVHPSDSVQEQIFDF